MGEEEEIERKCMIPSQKQYIIRKYIMAKSAKEALRKEKSTPAHEVYLDDKWVSEATVRGFDKKV